MRSCTHSTTRSRPDRRKTKPPGGDPHGGAIVAWVLPPAMSGPTSLVWSDPREEVKKNLGSCRESGGVLLCCRRRQDERTPEDPMRSGVRRWKPRARPLAILALHQFPHMSQNLLENSERKGVWERKEKASGSETGTQIVFILAPRVCSLLAAGPLAERWERNGDGKRNGDATRERKEREKGTSLKSTCLTPKPLASSGYAHVPEAPSPPERSISVMSFFTHCLPFSLTDPIRLTRWASANEPKFVRFPHSVPHSLERKRNSVGRASCPVEPTTAAPRRRVDSGSCEEPKDHWCRFSSRCKLNCTKCFAGVAGCRNSRNLY